MPFPRPTLTQLRDDVAADIAAGLPGVDALLRYSNLGVLGDVEAALANGLYGYLDWIARQSVPFTATDEYLEGWSALKDVTRKPATKASGKVMFTGSSGTIPEGATLTRSDGVNYMVDTSVTISGGSAEASVTAQLAGATGNSPLGLTLSLAAAISGVNALGTVSVAIVGGADAEEDDDLRNRMIAAYSDPASGGSRSDYVNWALAVDGVTRAWCVPGINGAGTVGVLFMMDDVRVAEGGFPQGSDGVAATETRGVAATGDQLTVADALYDQQPVTALIYAVSPVPNVIDLTIAGLSSASPTTKAAIADAFEAALLDAAQPGGETALSAITASIGGVAGASGFVITSVSASAGSVSPAPVGNITSDAGALPVAGNITYL